MVEKMNNYNCCTLLIPKYFLHDSSQLTSLYIFDYFSTNLICLNRKSQIYETFRYHNENIKTKSRTLLYVIYQNKY